MIQSDHIMKNMVGSFYIAVLNNPTTLINFSRGLEERLRGDP